MQMLASIFTIHITISFLVASISERNLCCSSPEKGFSWKSPSFFHREHCKKIQSAFLQGSRPCWVLSRMPLLGAFEVLWSWGALGLSEVCLVPDILIPLKVAIVVLIPLITCSSNSFLASLRVYDPFYFENYFIFLKNSFSIL